MAATAYVITSKRAGHHGTVVIDFRTLDDDQAHRITVPYAESDDDQVARIIGQVIADRKPRPGPDT